MGVWRERPAPCLPLRSDHPGSSSVVEKPSDLENQIGRMYFRSDPVKYCKTYKIVLEIVSQDVALLKKTRVMSLYVAHQSLSMLCGEVYL